MAQIALFHSVLGVRPGVALAAERLRAAGHQVRVVDQYDGRVFDHYDEAGAFVETIGGYPALMSAAVAAVSDLEDGFVAAGFSNGGGMAEYVGSVRPLAGVVMLSGALPLEMLGVQDWPAGVPAEIHYTLADPFRRPGVPEALADQIRAAGAQVGFFNYPGDGHLFTDPSLVDEYDEVAAERLWGRVLQFCADVGAPPGG